MSKLNLDKVIKEAIENKYSKENIDIPNVEETLAMFEKNIKNEENSGREKKKMIQFKALAIAASLVLVLGGPIMMDGLNKENGDPNVNGNNSGHEVQIPNPLKEFSSIEEAEEFAGFSIEEASIMKEGYERESIIGIKGEGEERIIRQRFINGDNSIVIEKYNEGMNDGDYNTYENEETIGINETEVIIAQRSDGTYKGKWSENGFEYSVTGNEEVSKDEIIDIIKGLK